jgi:hypothetical protein
MSLPGPTFALRDLALAMLAGRLDAAPDGGAEAAWLAALARPIRETGRAPDALLAAALEHPRREDAALAALARQRHLAPLETLAVALAAAVEDDLMTGRVLAYAQAPLGGSRPTLGLLAELSHLLPPAHRVTAAALALGPAVACGLLTVLHDGAPCPERPVAVPLPLSLALKGTAAPWPGGQFDGPEDPSLPPSVLEAAAQFARAIADRPATLVLRAASWAEGRAAARAVAGALRQRPFFTEAPAAPGLGVWLGLLRLLPVHLMELGPGELKAAPPIPFHTGPRLVLTGLEGALEAGSGELLTWRLPVPAVAERRELWRRALGDETLAQTLAATHRQGAERIARLGESARLWARAHRRSTVALADVHAVARTGEGTGLDALAQLLPEPVPDEALVLSEDLRAALAGLLARCRQRDGLSEGLGPAARARYSPGVRALLHGPSGTGKTLAAGWLATRLGLPLYRVDLAAVSSKYIGDTEKNLARLLARAEASEALLLFDEADALFGKRTDVRDANDRFANAQTNYLLQRLETFDGIVVLTTNSRARLDTAFARRLDAVIEFPAPAPDQRRALWTAHLGERHTLEPVELNRLAALCDLTGGQIRNVVLAAAVSARENGGHLTRAALLAALAEEYRKSGRPWPAGLPAPPGTPAAQPPVA